MMILIFKLIITFKMQNWQLVACSKVISIHEATNPSQPAFLYNPHRGIVNSVTYNHTNKLITSCGQDGKIIFVKAAQPDQMLLDINFNTGRQEPTSVSCCAFSSHSNYIAAGSVNKTVKIWQTQKNKQPMIKIMQTGAVSSIAWFSNEKAIASASISGDILLHNIKTGGIMDSFKVKDSINQIKLATDQRIAACTNSGSVLVWDITQENRQPICNFTDSKKLAVSTTSISISPFQPALLVASSIDSSLSFFDINDNKLIKTIATNQPLSAVSFHDNGHTIAVGGMNGSLMIYDLRKPSAPKAQLDGHQTQIKHLEFAYSRQYRKDKEIKENTRDLKVKQNIKEPPKQLKPKPSFTSNGSLSENKQEQEKQSKIRNLAKRQQYTPQIPKSVDLPPKQNNYVSSPPKPNLTDQSQLMNRINSVENEVSGIRSQMHEQFESLHMQIIRQLQIQQKQQRKMFEQFSREREEMKKEIEKLKHENYDLKKRTY